MIEDLDLTNNLCRNCNSNNIKFQYFVKQFDILKCSVCGYYQIGTLPTNEVIEQIYVKEYFEKGKYVDDYATKKEQKRRIKLLKTAGLRIGSKVLDFGMASGDFCRAAKAQFEVYGLDISKDAVEKGKIELPDIADRLFLYDTKKLPFQDNYFDAIVLWDVIEHLKPPQLIISQLKKKLRPGGFLLFSTPDISSLSAKLMKNRWHFMTPPEHLGFYSVKSAKVLIGNQGLEFITSKRLGKWVNCIFLLHKFSRIFPEVLNSESVLKLKKSFLKHICIYVPTNDILYVVCQLPNRK